MGVNTLGLEFKKNCIFIMAQWTINQLTIIEFNKNCIFIMAQASASRFQDVFTKNKEL
jgi:hypothetical protein